MAPLSVLWALPIVLLVGALAAGGWARLRLVRSDGAFRCKVRPPYDRLTGVRPRWPRYRTHARWVHDVLLVQKGLLRPRVEALPGRIPDDVIRRANAWEVRGLGVAPVLLVLQLDDGSIAEIAAQDRDRLLLVGPFRAAATRDRPETTADQRGPGR